MPTYLVAADTGKDGETEYISFNSPEEAQDFIEKYPQYHPRMIRTKAVYADQS